MTEVQNEEQGGVWNSNGSGETCDELGRHESLGEAGSSRTFDTNPCHAEGNLKEFGLFGIIWHCAQDFKGAYIL